MRFVAVGELLVDVLAEGRGHDARIRLRPAGSAFNAAVAAAAAGAEAAVVGRVGNDAAGRMILAELEERGVDRGVAHDLVLPERIEADAVLVSGYVPAAAEALARAQAPWVAFDAARLRE